MIHLGISDDEFWRLTPAEFNGLSDTYGKKQRVEVDLVKASAYWVESLHRTKRLPEFERWMNPPKPARALKGKEAEKRLQQHQKDSAMIHELLVAKAKAEGDQGDG